MAVGGVMKRELWMCLVLTLMSVVLAGLVLGLAGCGGGQPTSDDASGRTENEIPEEVGEPEAVPETAEEVEEEQPADTDTPEAEAAEPEESDPTTEPAEPEATEVDRPAALLEWERQGGSASHCDRMTIYPDGGVVAVLCLNGLDRLTVETTLSADQASQLNAWADQFASFSRRESDITRAAMRTVLDGRGEAVPTTEEKTAVARFAKDLFLALTADSD
jgi:hypothetical protein